MLILVQNYCTIEVLRQSNGVFRFEYNNNYLKQSGDVDSSFLFIFVFRLWDCNFDMTSAIKKTESTLSTKGLLPKMRLPQSQSKFSVGISHVSTTCLRLFSVSKLEEHWSSRDLVRWCWRQITKLAGPSSLNKWWLSHA